MSTITFYPTLYGESIAYRAYSTSLRAIESGKDLDTMQMALLSDPHVMDYDLIRIVQGPDDVIEIANNHDGTYECDRTDKEIRFAHNLLKMWENGVFDR